jgi:tetratricopeptide (TPR) repeat protein
VSRGWKANRLAAEAGVEPDVVYGYLAGDSLTRERLDELAAIMGLFPDDVERAVLAARLSLPREARPWTPVDPTEEERRIDAKYAAMAGAEMMDLVLDARELKTYSPAKQRARIEDEMEFQHWGLAYVLCAESEAAAPKNPDHALRLAELALYVAQHLEESSFKPRLEGWCTGSIGNVQRSVGKDLPEAGRTFDEAWRLWQQGEDPAGLLSEAYLLGMEASLRREQRQFPRAHRLLDAALRLALPEEKGMIFLNKAFALQEEGKHDAALQALDRSAEHIDSERQPRLVFGVRFNQASNLLSLRRTAEAVPIVAEARRLAEQLRNDIDLVRVLWLDANCASAMGRREKALEALGQVRREFEVRGFAFDFARASLDVALLYREEGQFAEIVVLAEQMLTIFRAQEVAREAIAAVVLFKEAAEKGQVTAGMVKRLSDYLRRAQREPGVRFEG